MTELTAIVKRSIAERGVLPTLAYGASRGPAYVMQVVRQLRDPTTPVSDFDARHGVDTDGARGDATHLRTLNIASPNWTHGVDYIPVKPERFHAALSSVGVPFDDFTFVDFGCGKGRAMLLASDYPFREVIGVDFSEELIAVAQRNCATYENPA
ncbi:MAG TPA: class I SAM-dependent methyltransferase, partial [Gemmatimonadaceae bacterium]|nr:class I SAM-dependent methyltransferase [Gemmatimonadaceae bacterium]